MEIARPFLLFLLLLLPALYYGYRRSLVHLTRSQRIVSLIMRAIIVVLLILSVADLQYLKTDDELAVIFLADLSDSISTNGLETSTDYINKALESRGAGQQPGVIGFTDRAEILKDFRVESEDELDLAEIKQSWLEAEVGIGSGADMNLLGNLANWGGGRDYFTQDPYNIPQIFAKETITASKSAIIDEPFIPQLIKPTQVLSGIDLQVAPFLLGYVATQPRPTAEISLVSDRGNPLLASWQYGLGKSVAFTSHAKARWASDWLEWPGYGKFWAQLVRDTMRKTTLSNFQAEIKQEKGNAHLAIDALGETGDFLNELESDISLIAPDLKKKQLGVAQTAPGRYELDFSTNDVGPYFVNIMQKRSGEVVNTQVTGTVVSYPEEYLVHNADEARLTQLAAVSGGRFNVPPEDTFRSPDQPVVLRIHLWRPFLIIALLLLLADIALRRIDFRRARI